MYRRGSRVHGILYIISIHEIPNEPPPPPSMIPSNLSIIHLPGLPPLLGHSRIGPQTRSERIINKIEARYR